MPVTTHSVLYNITSAAMRTQSTRNAKYDIYIYNIIMAALIVKLACNVLLKFRLVGSRRRIQFEYNYIMVSRVVINLVELNTISRYYYLMR